MNRDRLNRLCAGLPVAFSIVALAIVAVQVAGSSPAVGSRLPDERHPRRSALCARAGRGYHMKVKVDHLSPYLDDAVRALGYTPPVRPKTTLDPKNLSVSRLFGYAFRRIEEIAPRQSSDRSR